MGWRDGVGVMWQTRLGSDLLLEKCGEDLRSIETEVVHEGGVDGVQQLW